LLGWRKSGSTSSHTDGPCRSGAKKLHPDLNPNKPRSLSLTNRDEDVQRGLATVVAGGLIPATLLTLFIISTFYFVIERRIEHRVIADTDTATATI